MSVMPTDPTDAFRQVMSEPLVQVSLGEREASIHTDPIQGWLWMLYTTPDGRDISRIRSADPCEYASEYIGGARCVAGYMPDKAEEVEIEGTEMAASATGHRMWITILTSADAAIVRFLDADRNVVQECAVEIAPPRASRWFDRILKLFRRTPRGRHTFRG